ncbi:unnamed protein product, partial [Toxocara canis]|uniref:HU-CCDC81_euk_2 domain-containing protein n=1 Tax=Toxocara canis TaxID=6265 RepID=A0A183UQV5_TOXCA
RENDAREIAVNKIRQQAFENGCAVKVSFGLSGAMSAMRLNTNFHDIVSYFLATVDISFRAVMIMNLFLVIHFDLKVSIRPSFEIIDANTYRKRNQEGIKVNVRSSFVALQKPPEREREPTAAAQNVKAKSRKQ